MRHVHKGTWSGAPSGAARAIEAGRASKRGAPGGEAGRTYVVQAVG